MFVYGEETSVFRCLTGSDVARGAVLHRGFSKTGILMARFASFGHMANKAPSNRK